MKELRGKIEDYFNIFNEKSCSVHSNKSLVGETRVMYFPRVKAIQSF